MWHVLAKKTPAAAKVLRELARSQVAFSGLSKRAQRTSARRVDTIRKAKCVAVDATRPQIAGDQAGLRKCPPLLRDPQMSCAVAGLIVAAQGRPPEKLKTLGHGKKP